MKMLNKPSTNVKFRTVNIPNPHGTDITQYWISRNDFVHLFFASKCPQSLAFVDFIQAFLRESSRASDEYKVRLQDVEKKLAPLELSEKHLTALLHEKQRENLQLATVAQVNQQLGDLLVSKDRAWMQIVSQAKELEIKLSILQQSNESKERELEVVRAQMERESEARAVAKICDQMYSQGHGHGKNGLERRERTHPDVKRRVYVRGSRKITSTNGGTLPKK